MKRFSKKISNWGLAGIGAFLAMLCSGIYKMYNVVYGPPVEPCLYGPPPLELIDFLKNDTVNEQMSKDSVSIKNSTTVD